MYAIHSDSGILQFEEVGHLGLSFVHSGPGVCLQLGQQQETGSRTGEETRDWVKIDRLAWE